MAASLVFAIHNHQPVGNFDSVFSEAVARCYRPFLEALARHPAVRLSMHWSGSLYDWLEEHDRPLLDGLGTLASSGQVELLTGPYYEPILPAIPPWDQLGQIERMGTYLRGRFGVEASGAWIPERVWEPDLPDALARSGVRYTLLDDHHFLLAGVKPEELDQPYWVESTLGSVGVFPIEKRLRYRIPFARVSEILDDLDRGGSSPGGIRVFGDDGEKFGIWPRTFDWVYGEGWLEEWLSALEEGSRARSLQLREAWDAHPPVRRVALPAASYPEMMRWALPPEAQLQADEAEEWLRREGREDLAFRLAGGSWRAFLARYTEARRAHRRTTAVSARIESLGRSCLGRSLYDEARREIHRAECNCAYWHGVFGGIYLPHLRAAVQEHTIRAEAMADALQSVPESWFGEREGSEARLRSARVAVAVDLEQDGDIVEVAWRPRPFQLVGAVARRPEAYHAELGAARRDRATPSGENGGAPAAGGPDTIHAAIRGKEEGLARLLEYDRRPRSASQEWVLPAGRPAAGDAALREEIAGGGAIVRYRLDRLEHFGRLAEETAAVDLVGPAGETGTVRKRVLAGPGAEEFRVTLQAGLAEGSWLVSEWNLTLLTPDAPGRRLVLLGREPGAFAPGSRGRARGVAALRLEDREFLRVAATLRCEPEALLEWGPVETVSLSEAGAERIYQGTSFLLGWPAERAGVAATITVSLEEALPDT